MTIKECKDREKRIKQLLNKISIILSKNQPKDKTYIAPYIDISYEDYDLILLALARSMAIEELNVAELKKEEQK